jgi:hypothetical protein
MGFSIACMVPRAINNSTLGIPKNESMPRIKSSLACLVIFSISPDFVHSFIRVPRTTLSLRRLIRFLYSPSGRVSDFSRVSMIIPMLTPLCQRILHILSIDSSISSLTSCPFFSHRADKSLYQLIESISDCICSSISKSYV